MPTEITFLNLGGDLIPNLFLESPLVNHSGHEKESNPTVFRDAQKHFSAYFANIPLFSMDVDLFDRVASQNSSQCL